MVGGERGDKGVGDMNAVDGEVVADEDMVEAKEWPDGGETWANANATCRYPGFIQAAAQLTIDSRARSGVEIATEDDRGTCRDSAEPFRAEEVGRLFPAFLTRQAKVGVEEEEGMFFVDGESEEDGPAGFAPSSGGGQKPRFDCFEGMS